MKESLIFGICLLILIFITICVTYTVVSFVMNIKKEKEKKRENDSMHPDEPKPGDIIVSEHEWKNPFLYDSLNYETVKSVMKNDRGEIYFKTYSSDFEGNEVEVKYNYGRYSLHEIGQRYYREDWVLVNHVELKRQ